MRRRQTEPVASDALPADTATLEQENRLLQARLDALTEEVGRNDSLLRKTQER
jgi:hypothetical protein